MKHVVKKMHGLNTVQYTDFVGSVQQNVLSGSLQAAAASIFDVSGPSQLNTIIPGFSGSSTTQFWLKRLYYKLTLNNVGAVPYFLEHYIIYTRNDTISGSTDFVQLLTQDVTWAGNATFPAYRVAYASPFTGDTFRKSFKVLHHRRCLMRPNQPRTFTMKCQKNYLNKAISQEWEGDTNFSQRKGNILHFFRYYGVVSNCINSTGSGVSSLGPVVQRGIIKTYLSYYRMDDVLPQSSIVSTLPLTLNGNNTAFMPVYTLPVLGTTNIGGLDPVHVQTP